MEDLHYEDHKTLANFVTETVDYGTKIAQLQTTQAVVQGQLRELHAHNDKNNRTRLWIIGIAFTLVSSIWTYMSILSNDISNLETKLSVSQEKLTTLQERVKSNEKFVAEWPTGRLGSLPDDNVQNTKIEHIEKQIESLHKN